MPPHICSLTASLTWVHVACTSWYASEAVPTSVTPKAPPVTCNPLPPLHRFSLKPRLTTNLLCPYRLVCIFYSFI